VDHDLARQCVHGSLGPHASGANDESGSGGGGTQVFVNPHGPSEVAATAKKRATNDDDDDDDDKAKKIAIAKEAKNKAKITGTEKLERG